MSNTSRARTFDHVGHSLGVDIHKATTWSIVLSLLMMVAGVFALFVPSMTGVAVTLVFGWLLIVSGALHLGFAWQAGRARAVLWEILLGLLYGGIGFYLLAKPVLGLEALTLALAVYLVFEGALEFILAFYLRPLPGSGWLLFDGVVTLLLAVLIWRGWPTSSTWVVGTLVGLSMFFSGLTRLMLSLSVRGVVS
jgi:uncharacterized membrane protein HdeD (DUF308 family)